MFDKTNQRLLEVFVAHLSWIKLWILLIWKKYFYLITFKWQIFVEVNHLKLIKRSVIIKGRSSYKFNTLAVLELSPLLSLKHTNFSGFHSITKSEFGAFKPVSVSILSFDNSFKTGYSLVLQKQIDSFKSVSFFHRYWSNIHPFSESRSSQNVYS